VLNTQAVNADVPPSFAAERVEELRGKTLHWGGEIISVDNHQDRTDIYVLAYPLRSSGAPRRDAQPAGRFLIQHAGFLDPVDYAPGRLITTVATITGATREQVGAAVRSIPVVTDRQLHLWRYDPPRVVPQIGIGIGIGF